MEIKPQGQDVLQSILVSGRGSAVAFDAFVHLSCCTSLILSHSLSPFFPQGCLAK